MSFSSDIKKELMRHMPKAKHCQIAELAAMLILCGDIYISTRDTYMIRLRTENLDMARASCQLIRSLFQIVPEVSIRKNPGESGSTFCQMVIAKDADAKRVLMAFKMLLPSGFPDEDYQVSKCIILKKECCRRAWLKGAFLAAGSVSDPNHYYHFEIVCSNEDQGIQVMEVLSLLRLDAKIVERKRHFVVYIKEVSQISDLLALMEAPSAMMELENIRIVRGMRGNVNRQVNCETANINKTVNAAVKQLEDISYIKKVLGLSKLTNRLDEIALVRVQYPSATLKELGEHLDPPIGKSGVNHRLRKLGQIADQLREERGDVS